MTTVLLILAIVAVLVWRHFAMKKIDEEEARALNTPGAAYFLRNNFGAFINAVLSDNNTYIIFERSDQIKFGKKDKPGLELIIGNMMDYGGPIMHVIVIKGGSIVKEMKFQKGADQNHIINSVLPYFN